MSKFCRAMPEDQTNLGTWSDLIFFRRGLLALLLFLVGVAGAQAQSLGVGLYAPETVATDSNILYRMYAVKSGAEPISNIVVRQYLPEGVGFPSVITTGWYCSTTATLVECRLSDMDGTSVPGLFVAVKAPATPGQITSTCEWTHDGMEGFEDAGCSVVVEVVPSPDEGELAVALSPLADEVVVGDAVTWVLNIKNTGDVTVPNAKLDLFLPSSLDFVSAESDSGVCYQVSWDDMRINCPSQTLQPGAEMDILVETVVQSTGVIMLDTCSVSGTNASAACSSEVMGLEGPLRVIKFMDPASMVVNSQGLYNIRVINGTSQELSNIIVRDTLPEEVRYSFAMGFGWSCTHDGSLSGGVVECKNVHFPAGTYHDFFLFVYAQPEPGSATNVCAWTHDGMAGYESEGCETTNEILGVPTIRASMQVQPFAILGETVPWNIQVSNVGTAPAGHATVEGVLPEGLEFSGYQSSFAECVYESYNPDRRFRCTLEEVPVGDNVAQITIQTVATQLGWQWIICSAYGSSAYAVPFWLSRLNGSGDAGRGGCYGQVDVLPPPDPIFHDGFEGVIFADGFETLFLYWGASQSSEIDFK